MITPLSDDQVQRLLAAASCANTAAMEMIEAVRDRHYLSHMSELASGETLITMADGLRLLIAAMDDPGDDANQLHGALARFLEDRT